jgi:DNA-binding NtrC family response regulator
MESSWWHLLSDRTEEIDVNTISQPWNFSNVPKNSPLLRILIVDDEALIRWSLVQTLSDSGHEAVEAMDGAGAIRAVSAAPTPFDVALVDLRLPDSNDLSLLSRLRRMSPTTQIVLMTAYGTPEVVQGALDLGAFRVVSKPLDMNDLTTLVADAHAAAH